jgi:predicted transcriptional regulator of viral defense system
MRFEDLHSSFLKQPFFELKNVALFFNEPLQQVKVQFSRFVDAKKIYRLRNNLYIFNEQYRLNPINPLYLSAYILQPSYISMEKALEYYGMIPENVFMITALTTKRSNTFSNIMGQFNYRHIQEKLFFGYETIGNHNQFFIATPEKTLLDYVYVNRLKVSESMLNELRLQNIKLLNIKKMRKFASIFSQKNLDVLINLIENLINEEKEFKIL